MNKSLLTLFISFIFTGSIFAQSVATDTCISSTTPSGNVFIYVNYDGGVLNINVDQNIPNIKIGVCTYEPVTINISGAFAANVTEVRYAGYVSTGNFHCSNSPATTTINGAGSAATSVNFLPPSTLSNPNGNASIVCGYSCSTTTNQGGCNTADQIQDYFLTTMGGTFDSYYTQYGCWSTTSYNISSAGNCFLTPINDTTVSAFTSTASTVCAGSTVDFNDISPNAVSWDWAAPGSNTPSVNDTNLVGVFWTAAGTYTVTLTVNDGTGTCSAEQVITVLPQPTLTLAATPNPICPGDTSALFVGGANSYQWGGGPSGAVYQVSPIITSWYDVTGTDLSACTKTDSVQVIVYPVPTTPTINYSGGILTASPSAGSYQWYLNGSAISGATGQNYTPTQNGDYTVTYADANGCTSSTSIIYTVSGIGVGISELNNILQIFPNPGTGVFQISIPNTNAEAKIEVVDILGKVVYSKNIIFNNSYTIDLSDQAKGSYEVKMWIGMKVVFGKLILQ